MGLEIYTSFLKQAETAQTKEGELDREHLVGVLKDIEEFGAFRTSVERREELSTRIIASSSLLNLGLKDPTARLAVLQAFGEAATENLAIRESRGDHGIKEVREAVHNLFLENWTSLSRAISADLETGAFEESPLRRVALRVIHNLILFGREEEQEFAKRVFIKKLVTHQDIRNIPMYQDDIAAIIADQDSIYSSLASVFLTESLCGSGKGVKVASSFVFEWAIRHREHKVKKAAQEAVKRVINSMGLDGNKFLGAWGQSTKVENLDIEIFENFRRILVFEKANPGIVKYLNKECGVYDFGRYPAEILEQQFKSKDDQETPYGVIFYPRSDHNGAFYQNIAVLRNLFRDLGGKFLLRVAEGENKLDMIRQMRRFDRRYGRKHKISFALVGGHGTAESLQLGRGEGKKDFLHKEDMVRIRHRAPRYRRFFYKPTFILISCDTGATFGLGDFISRAVDATVIAPNTPTNIKEINVEFRENRPIFRVKYHDEGADRTYVAGRGWFSN